MLRTLCNVTTLAAIPNTNNLVVFSQPERLDNPLLTAFAILCRVHNQWTALGTFYTKTTFLDQIFPPDVVGHSSDTNVSAVVEMLNQDLVMKFLSLMETRFCPSKD